jgi:FAD/FMN-containing dehydrogenase
MNPADGLQSNRALDAGAVVELKTSLRGRLLQAQEDGYDSARVVWNAMIGRRPALIAQCRGAADVIASVNFARRQGLAVAVRAGGHNVAGYAVCNGGLMIDLSAMRAVRIDPQGRRAWVQGGATWGDVDCETTALGLATPGGLVSQTGVAGLTLSGGIGWLRGTHGLCVDNIASVDIVTADGNLLRASEDQNSDLFWALRGGGGNFGIVTCFEFRLHPVAPELMFCAPCYPETRASEIMPLWRDFMARAPEQLSGLAEFSTIPNDPAYPAEARGVRVVALACVYDGPADEGEALVRPLREFGAPLVDFSGKMPYRAIQALYDSLFPAGRDRCYWKSLYLTGLDETVIAEILSRLAQRPSEMTYASVWKFSGAVQRVAADATAFGDRSMPYMLSIDSIWAKPEEDAANIAWTRQFWSDMQRHSNGRLYLNFPGHGEDEDLVRSAFGAKAYARLAEIKRKYDPTNFFRMNQNILPG